MIGSKPILTYEDVRQVPPQLAAYTQDRLFGDVWKRPGLAPRDRSIVTLAAFDRAQSDHRDAVSFEPRAR